MKLDTNFWKKYFKEYDVLNRLIPYDNLLYSICEKLEVKKNDIVLDLGSGTGNLSIRLQNTGSKIIGIDYSTEGMKIHKNKQPDVEIIIHNIKETLPFPDEYFDKVASNNVLYTISRDERNKIFEEIKRVLKPGGITVIANLNTSFSPIKIYGNHIKLYLKRFGLLKTITHILSLIIPTIKIFYYNYLINKENGFGSYDFFEINEQKEILEKLNFKNVSETEIHYSGSSYLNKAIK